MVKLEGRKPYNATSSRHLVVSLDIGTTFSGSSFAVLEPGEVPKIESVSRYPGQEDIGGSWKTPSILCYDTDGSLQAVGAEAEQLAKHGTIKEEGWHQVAWFKLHLRPADMKLDKPIPALPPSISPLRAFADFLQYLADCVKTFIEEHRIGGEILWTETYPTIEWIISHPNGWQGAQQAKLRQAAIKAGLVPATDEGRSRIHFVTEGEASLHACVDHTLTPDMIKEGNRFIVADAGGGTIDISSYMITDLNPLRLEETAASACVVAGSMFVTLRAQELFARKLKNSRFGDEDTIEHIASCFDATTKRTFSGKQLPSVVLFGSPLDKDLDFGIRNGQLKLTSDEVKELFEPSCQAALEAIEEQIQRIEEPIQAVFLVGGFAGSTYLFNRLRDALKDRIEVCRPEMPTAKAVAEGAISFFLDRYVSARIARHTFGGFGRSTFHPHNPAHRMRIKTIQVRPSGSLCIPGHFDPILHKHTRVEETQEFSTSFFREVTDFEKLSKMKTYIYCYTGGSKVPEWRDEAPDDAFKSVCKIEADISGLKHLLSAYPGVDGNLYWTYDFDVVVRFGLTELAAFIQWEENGVTKRGPAKIIYELDD